MGHIFGVDAGTLIADADDDLLGAGFAADADFAFGGVFDGVRDEVCKDLPNPCFVGGDNGKYFGKVSANLTGASLRGEAFRKLGCEVLYGDVVPAQA